MSVFVVSEHVSHGDVLFFLFLLLVILLLLIISSSSWGSGTSSSGWGSSNVGEKSANISSLECLGVEAWPVSLDFVSTCLDNLGKFSLRDFELSVVEEKSSVSAYELIFLGLVKRSNFNLSHFSYLIIL